jgi:hypothetical protein
MIIISLASKSYFGSLGRSVCVDRLRTFSNEIRMDSTRVPWRLGISGDPGRLPQNSCRVLYSHHEEYRSKVRKMHHERGPLWLEAGQVTASLQLRANQPGVPVNFDVGQGSMYLQTPFVFSNRACISFTLFFCITYFSYSLSNNHLLTRGDEGITLKEGSSGSC